MGHMISEEDLDEWRRVITECSNRPKGMTQQQWLDEHGVGRSKYAYWREKLQPKAENLSEREVNTRLKWLKIIKECESRPAGKSKARWLREHGINKSRYQFWKNVAPLSEQGLNSAEQRWREFIRECQNRPLEIGLSQYLKAKGVSYSSYCGWCRRLGISITEYNRQQRLRLKWSKIVEECKNRPEGMTVDEWLNDKGISHSTYYSWHCRLSKS